MKHLKTLTLLLFIVMLSTCSNPADNNDGGTGTFTINFGINSRAVNYPPNDIPIGANPMGPSLAELKFEVIFTQVGSSAVKTFTFIHGQAIKGTIAVGTYVVTMDVR